MGSVRVVTSSHTCQCKETNKVVIISRFLLDSGPFLLSIILETYVVCSEGITLYYAKIASLLVPVNV